MEKVFIKSNSEEILIKGAVAEGHTDIFSYEPDSLNARSLGNLFVVGHIQHDSDDMAYAINLISALAKREYYANSQRSAKEAFGETLKKINEVVEEFFEKDGLSLNVGIFTIAAEQMLISKLGKFKIFLARDDKNVDVLNNISLFDKEATQEKQFSSIISGKVSEHDRIFAFYPTRAMVARERFIKSDLLKLDRSQFIEKLKAIKQEKDSFSCTAVYVNVEKTTEVTPIPEVNPPEMSAATLANSSNKPKRQNIGVTPETPDKKTRKSVISPNETVPASRPELVAETAPKSNVSDSATKYEEPIEMPRIIPAEFSLGKKQTAIGTFFRRLRVNGMSPKSKAVISLVIVAIIVGVSWGVEAIFVTSPEDKAAQTAIEQAQTSLKLAQTKASQSDIAGARSLLLGSIATVGDTTKAQREIKQQLIQVLDNLDSAQDVSPSLVYQIASELGTGRLVTALSDGVGFYSIDTATTLAYMGSSASSSSPAKIDQKDFQPNHLGASDASLVALDTDHQKVVTVQNGKLKLTTLKNTSSVNGVSFYEGNLYMLSANTIQKVVDVAKGGEDAVNWLKDSALPADSVSITVDGNVYVLDKTGTITTYFRGKKTAETKTSTAAEGSTIFMTASDYPSFILFDTKFGRIHFLDKTSGNLTKTYKLGTQDPIIDASLASDGTIYFLTNDNKIWKVN